MKFPCIALWNSGISFLRAGVNHRLNNVPSYSKAIPNNLNFISTFTTVEICLMVIYLSYTISKASAKFQHFVVLHWWISGGSDCHFANCLVFLQASKDRWRPFFFVSSDFFVWKQKKEMFKPILHVCWGGGGWGNTELRVFE